MIGLRHLALSLGTFAMVVLLSTACQTPPKFRPLPQDPLFGDPAPSSVKNWIRIANIGPSNHPFVVLWFSTQSFDLPWGFEKVVTLASDEYEALAHFVNANRCAPLERDGPNWPPHWGTIEIDQFANGGRETVCMMPCDKATGFLTQLQSLPGIKWTSQKLDPVLDVAADAMCQPDSH